MSSLSAPSLVAKFAARMLRERPTAGSDEGDISKVILYFLFLLFDQAANSNWAGLT